MAYRRRGLQVLVALGAGHAIEDAAVGLKDAMPQEAVVLKSLLISCLLLHDGQLLQEQNVSQLVLPENASDL